MAVPPSDVNAATCFTLLPSLLKCSSSQVSPQSFPGPPGLALGKSEKSQAGSLPRELLGSMESQRARNNPRLQKWDHGSEAALGRGETSERSVLKKHSLSSASRGLGTSY